MMHDKRGDPFDVPKGRMRAAERGAFLEDKVVDIYLMEHPGSKVVRFRPKAKEIEILEPGSDKVKVVKRPKRMRANKDRMMWAPLDAPYISRSIVRKQNIMVLENVEGVIYPLECKTMAEQMWWKTREDGLPSSHKLQPLWYLMDTGCDFCDVAVYWPDGHMWMFERVEREPEVFRLILMLHEKFWETFEAGEDFGPELKPPVTDSRCGGCPWRVSCLPDYYNAAGRELVTIPAITDPKHVELIQEYDQLEERLESTKERMKLIEAEFAQVMVSLGDAEESICDGRPVRYKKGTRSKTNHDELKQLFPKEYFENTSEYPHRELKIGKRRKQTGA